MNFKEIIDRMERGGLTPDEISAYRNHCAGWLFTLNTQYGELVALSALWITANRENYKSHAECERAWEAREEGQKQIKLKYQIKGIEHIQDALETNWFLLNRERKEAGI